MNDKTRQQFLADLCPLGRTLIASLMECACGCEIADFFRGQSGLRIQAADVAGMLHCPLEQVQTSLKRLASLGVLQCHTAVGLAFYSLTDDPSIVAAIEQFWLPRDARIRELRQVEEALHLCRSIAARAATPPISLSLNTQNGASKEATPRIELR